MQELLLSDLICLYIQTKEKKYIQELEYRMHFCGYTKDEILMFIEFETNIINKRKDKYKKSLINNKYIIGKKDNINIFKNIDEYMYNPESNGKKTLMICETLTIIDEAIFLTYSKKLNEYNSKEEILSLSKENESNWLFFEFCNRLEYICRCANKIFDNNKSSIYIDKIHKLYDNEMQICIKRWKDIDVSSKNFIPYTNQYFE